MRLIAAGTLVVLSCTAHAEPLPPSELVELADFVMRESPSRAELASRARELEPVIEAAEDESARMLLSAMREFLVGFGELGNGSVAEADRRFTSSVSLALGSTRASESSEGYRVLADAYNQLLDIRSPAYKVFNAAGARRAAVRAVDLDPSNPLAHIAAASYFVSAPAVAGGDLDRGRGHLRAAAQYGDGSDYQRFLVIVWEGRLAAAEGRPEEAVRLLSLAYGIYPDNWWLASVAEGLGVRLPR